MQEPWDRPSLVREGDTHPDITHRSVGRVLSEWEGVEIQLGYIYTAIVEKHGDWYALLEYGEGRAFKGRFDILRNAISDFFVKHPNQDDEATLDRFLVRVTNFAARRHDVAHGIVRDRRWANWRLPHDPGEPSGFFLLPSHYKARAYDQESAFPLYVYTEYSMEQLRYHLGQLNTEAMGMAQLIRRRVEVAASSRGR